jgi:hypothetical protein
VQPTLHYQTDVPISGSEPDPSDVASGIWGLVGATLKATAANDVTFTSVDVAEQLPPGQIGAAGTFAISSGQGTVVPNSQLPYATVPLINLHTGVASRSSRGWVHLTSPRLSTYVGNDVWTAAYLNLLNLFGATLDDSFDLGTLQITHVNPVVYSRTRHLRGQTPFTFRVKSASANPQVRWLRSRLSSP